MEEVNGGIQNITELAEAYPVIFIALGIALALLVIVALIRR